jgi:hypothetical protein
MVASNKSLPGLEKAAAEGDWNVRGRAKEALTAIKTRE